MVTGTLTKAGVCYNVERSPYSFEYMGYTFFFSSPGHRDSFMEKARVRREWLTDSLSKRFHFKVEADLVAVFQLYCQVETRGFHVVDELGNVYRDRGDLRFKAVL